jgi:hypothetical protein
MTVASYLDVLQQAAPHKAWKRLRALGGRIASYAPVRNLCQMPLTIVGAGCIDAAAFVGCTIAGLVVTGVSLIVLELLIADGDE